MNTELQQLQTLLEQAEALRDTAIALLQQTQQRADAAASQAEQLVNYRSEYRQRWAQQFSQRGAIEIVQCYQGFNDRLQQAIDAQSQMAEQCRTQLEHARALLQEREMRVASIRKLIERRQQEQRRVAERRDQQLTDEAAQRAGWNPQINAMGLRHQFS